MKRNLQTFRTQPPQKMQSRHHQLCRAGKGQGASGMKCNEGSCPWRASSVLQEAIVEVCRGFSRCVLGISGSGQGGSRSGLGGSRSGLGGSRSGLGGRRMGLAGSPECSLWIQCLCTKTYGHTLHQLLRGRNSVSSRQHLRSPCRLLCVCDVPPTSAAWRSCMSA